MAFYLEGAEGPKRFVRGQNQIYWNQRTTELKVYVLMSVQHDSSLYVCLLRIYPRVYTVRAFALQHSRKNPLFRVTFNKA